MTADELKRALQTTSEVVITVTGRRSGREISHPVWFVLEGDELYLLPVHGSDTNWYRNVLKSATIRVSAGQAEATAEATPITDAGAVDDVIGKFRDKYDFSDVDRYYPKHDVAVELALG